MTLLFPDVSQYTPNVDPARYPILIARATLSDRVADPTYLTFKAKSAAAGALFAAYHWLNHGNLAAQARWCYQQVGPDVPVMIDAEDVAGNTGYAGPLTVADITGFAAQYRALGGIVSLCYLPFWYWSGAMGAPHQLDQLTAAGLGLVSSNYPNAGYTDNGPGWATYYAGAPAPVQWQYTSTPIDMNAFRGTVAEYAALIGMPQVAAESIEVDMFLAKRDDPNDGTIWLCSAMQSRALTDATQLRDLLYLHDTGVIQLAVGNNDTEWLPADANHPRMIRNGYSPGVFGPVDQSAVPVEVQVAASEVAGALATNPDFLAAVAEAVNDDAKTRRGTWA